MKVYMKILMGLFVLLINFSPHTTFAKIQTISTTSQYVMGDGDNKINSQKKAQELAIQSAVEQIGVYVESYSKTENYQLKQDEISTISASIIKVNSSNFIWTMQDNGVFVVTCNLSVTMDDSNLDEIIKHGVDSKKKDEENARLRKESEDNQIKINDLKSQLQELQTASATGSTTNPIAITWFNKGAKHDDNHEFDMALQDYEKAKLNDDHFLMPYISECYVYSTMGKYNEAKKQIADLFKITKNFPESYYALGQVYFYMDDSKNAIKNMQKAYELGFNTAKMYCMIGGSYRKLGDLENAYTYLRKAYDMAPDNSFVVYEMSRYYMSTNDTENAIYYLKRAHDMDWTTTYYWYYLALTNENQGNYSEAVNLYRKYISEETRMEKEYSMDRTYLLDAAKTHIDNILNK